MLLLWRVQKEELPSPITDLYGGVVSERKRVEFSRILAPKEAQLGEIVRIMLDYLDRESLPIGCGASVEGTNQHTDRV